jgi:signal transduction histidine kinase
MRYNWVVTGNEITLFEAIANSIHSPFFLYQAGMILLGLGVCMSVIWYIASISERKNFADMLRRLSMMTKELKEAEQLGHFGSFVWDRDGGMVFWSEEMFNLFGLVPGQRPPTLEKMLSLVYSQDRDRAVAEWEKARTKPGSFSIVLRITGANNVLRHIRFEGTTVLGGDHATETMRGVAHDITREVEVDRAKSEFVSLASHQLKTPLTAIGWLSEGLLSGDQGPLTPEQKNYIENIHKTDRQMMEMVNDLLNVSRIELGTLQLHPEEIDITVFVRSVIDEQAKVATDKKIDLALTLEPNLPKLVVDKNLIRMVFQNLVSNAIKYTPVGGSVKVDITRGGGTKSTIFVSVADTGMGIPKDEQDKIFSKLHRAKNAQAAVPDGTGLGLYVVKTIIERVHGVITFDSKEGKGTTFLVTLPVVWQDSGSV